MSEMISIAREELAHLEARARKSAMDKSYLQLVIRLMNGVSAASGLEDTVDAVLRNVIDVIGGANIILYYWIDSDIFFKDAYGKKMQVNTIDDDLVQQVIAARGPIEHEQPFSHTMMQTPEFTKAYTWVYPLLVGPDIIGVFKMENLHIGMRDLYRYLPTFFNFVALTLKNEILGYTRLQETYNQLSKANTELIVSEERYRTLVETMHEGILVVDGEGRLTYVNRQMSDMLEMTPDKMIGRECAHFIEAKQREVFETNLKSAYGQFALKFEVNFICSDGHIVSTLVTPTTLYDGEGCFHSSFAVVTDITTLKQLQTRLLHAQKLESIGQLAAGIAHEINTPTQYVVSNARFLGDAFKELVEVLAAYESLFFALKNCLPTSTALEEVEMSREDHQLEVLFKEISGALDDTFEGLERISNIVRSVKQFAHSGQDATASADLNDAIRNTIAVSTNEWKYVANVETDLDPALPLVPCNISGINQVVLNLIVNAAHSIADQQIVSGVTDMGTITLMTRNLGAFAEIRITDTGSGIPENIRSRIFDPFFTTKSVGKGSGQGLAIARTIITETHHGTIDFETAVGGGTTFIIRLPIIA